MNWTSNSCSIEYTFDILQLKHGQKFNYLYCYKNNIIINKRLFACPKLPFKLRVNTTFSIGTTVYEPIVNSSIIATNYFWSDMTNKFLTHVKNSSNSSLQQYFTYKQIPLFPNQNNFNVFL